MYIGRRNVEGGGRQQTFANNSFRAVAGVRGSINDAWGYDVSAQYSNVAANTGTLNYFVTSRLQRALDVVDVNGVPTCQSVIDGTDAACVPWNPFQPNSVTPAQLNYLQAAGLQIGRINQEIYNGVVNGDLGVYGIKLPTASDGVQVVFGTEYRRDTLVNYRRRPADAGPSGRFRRPDDRHQRRHLREGALHGSPRAAGAGPGVCGKLVVRHRVPVFGLR
jgi:hypothetical protein